MLDGAYFNRSAAFALGSGPAGPSIVKNANCHCFSMCDLKPANKFLNFWLPNSSTAATMPRPRLSYLHAVYGSQLPDALDLTKFNFFTMVVLIGGASIKTCNGRWLRATWSLSNLEKQDLLFCQSIANETLKRSGASASRRCVYGGDRLRGLSLCGAYA